MSYVERGVRLSLGSAGEGQDGFCMTSTAEVGEGGVENGSPTAVCLSRLPARIQEAFKVQSDVI